MCTQPFDRNVWSSFIYSFFWARPFDQKLGSSLIYFFHLHTTMIFFFSFILSLCTTIRPKNRVLINLLFLFVHDHLPKLGITLTLLFILFLDVSIFRLLYSCQILPLYFRPLFLAVLPLHFVRYIHSSTTYIFRTLYSLESCSYILYAVSMAIWRLCRCSPAVPCSVVPRSWFYSMPIANMFHKDRSSRPQLSCKNVVFKKSTKFTMKQLCCSLVLKKATRRRLINERLLSKYFPVSFTIF